MMLNFNGCDGTFDNRLSNEHKMRDSAISKIWCHHTLNAITHLIYNKFNNGIEGQMKGQKRHEDQPKCVGAHFDQTLN